jgi:hypothetical protein
MRPRRDYLDSAAVTAAPNGLICTPFGDGTRPRRDANIRRYMGDRRSPSRSGHITLDIRVIIAPLFESDVRR